MPYRILRTWNDEFNRPRRLLINTDPNSPEYLVFQRPALGRMEEPDWTDLKIVPSGNEEVSWILGAVGEIVQNPQ